MLLLGPSCWYLSRECALPFTKKSVHYELVVLGEERLSKRVGVMAADVFDKLQDLLKQLFQFESKDLNFGIYRIMNHKREEIEHFINEGLAKAVEEALKNGAVAQQAARAEELRQTKDQIRENFGEYAVDPQGVLNPSFHETPLGKRYLDLRSKVGEATNREQLKAT